MLTALTFNPVLFGLRGNYSDIRLLSHFGERGATRVWINLISTLRLYARYDTPGEGGKHGVSVITPTLTSKRE